MSNRTIIAYNDLTINNKSIESTFNSGLGFDGVVSQNINGMHLSSRVFTSTIPQGPLGRLDYYKLALTSPVMGLQCSGTTHFETCMSGKQHFTTLDPQTGCPVSSACGTAGVGATTLIPPVFSTRVKNVKSDPRLATAGLLMYDPDNDFTMGVLATDHAYYAIHGILGLQPIAQEIGTGDLTLPDGRNLPFAGTQPAMLGGSTLNCSPVATTVPRRAHLSVQYLASRESHDPINDFRQLGMAINTGRDFVAWTVNGERTVLHHGIGRPGPDEYRVLNMKHGSATTSVVPTRMHAIFFTGDMLDLSQPINTADNFVETSMSLANQNSSHLVALDCPVAYSNVQAQENGTYGLLGPSSFATPNPKPTDKLFGQGSSITFRYFAVLGSTAPEDTLYQNLCAGNVSSTSSSSCSSSSSEECGVVDNMDDTDTEDDCNDCNPTTAVERGAISSGSAQLSRLAGYRTGNRVRFG